MKNLTPYQVIQQINSRREFLVYSTELHGAPARHSIQDILNYSISNDYEWAHSMMDILDSILDLQINESVAFEPSRDYKLYKGLIKRVR